MAEKTANALIDEAAEHPDMDEAFKRQGDQITDEMLRRKVEHSRAERAAWDVKQEKKGKD